MLFLTLGLTLCFTPWLYGGGWTWALVWLGLDMLLLGIAYMRGDTGIFGKRPDGTLAPSRVLIFLPYLLFTLAVWHLCRLLPEPAVQRINDKLIIGRRLLPGELPAGIHVILDLTSEFAEPAAVRKAARYVSLPTLDATAPTPEALMAAIRSLQPQEHVFIHCAQGHGRTAMAAIALLMHRGETSNVADGLRLLKAIRPGVSLSPGQWQCLEKCADALRQS
ncbi:phosphatase domain-containing protein [Prosthecobacter sp.]